MIFSWHFYHHIHRTVHANTIKLLLKSYLVMFIYMIADVLAFLLLEARFLVNTDGSRINNPRPVLLLALSLSKGTSLHPANSAQDLFLFSVSRDRSPPLNTSSVASWEIEATIFKSEAMLKGARPCIKHSFVHSGASAASRCIALILLS